MTALAHRPASLAKPQISLDETRASCPAGFVAAGVACGLRKSGKPDLALFLAEKEAAVAGVFTQNLLCAAPVTLSKERLAAGGGRGRAVLINSGCANAATGEEGMRRAVVMADSLAGALSIGKDDVLIASTGVIGPQLETDKILGALPALTASTSPAGLDDASLAIMTTDTRAKRAQAVVRWEGGEFTVAGVAKGSGMIHPNMATMLGVLMTDAEASPEALQSILRRCTSRTFNRVSVDGDTSTNDCVFAMASGEAGAVPESLLEEAMEQVCRSLSMQIVRDGEGAAKVIRVRTTGALDEAEAEMISRAVASSLLVRTAIAGGDPNWGRIAAAIGRSGAPLAMDDVRVEVGGLPLFVNGAPAGLSRDELAPAFAGPDVEIDILLSRGDGEAECLTCDLTEGYIRINAYYTT